MPATDESTIKKERSGGSRVCRLKVLWTFDWIETVQSVKDMFPKIESWSPDQRCIADHGRLLLTLSTIAP